MYEVTEKILREVRKVIVGKDDVVEKVWISILAQGHVLLEDVPGVGKTTMALAFSKALGLVLAESEHIPVSEREMEYIMLRLRTTEGMNIREFENRFRRRFDPLGARLEVYAGHGLAQRTEQGWRLTPRGFLVSNQIIGELQELLNREKLERLRRAQEGDYRVV